MITKLRKDGSNQEFFAYPFLTDNEAKQAGWAGYFTLPSPCITVVSKHANVTASHLKYRLQFNTDFGDGITTAQARQVIEALQACIAYAEKEHYADAS